MSKTGPNQLEPRKSGGWLDPGPANLQVIYILYLAGFVIGISPLIGIILAYMNRGKATGWVETHYVWAIRTFWIGLLYSFASLLLTFVVIGFVLFFAAAIWFIVRCILGLQAVGRGEPMKNAQSWTI